MSRVIGSFLLLCMMLSSLIASVKLTADNEIYKGEAFVFSVRARAHTIAFPEVNFIEGFLVELISTSSEAYTLGGQKLTQITKRYQFYPDKDFVLPSFEISIDGDKALTQSLDVLVKKREKTIVKDSDLQMSVSKTEVLVGEQLFFDITLSSKNLNDSQIKVPKFDNFTLEVLSEDSYETKEGVFIEVIHCLLEPLKVGKFQLHPAQSMIKRIAHKEETIFSNALNIEVSALPEGIRVIGSYEMKSTLLKQVVKKGEAVSMRLELIGKGNINNLQAFTFTIENASVYVKSHAENPMIKDFTIISNQDFIIPSIELDYFDVKEKRVIRLSSPRYKVLVGDKRVDLKKTHKRLLIKKIENKGLTMIEKLFYIITGILLGLLLGYLLFKVKALKKNINKKALIQELKAIHDKDIFFKKVLPLLGQASDIDRLIYQLEEGKKEFIKIKKSFLHLLALKERSH